MYLHEAEPDGLRAEQAVMISPVSTQQSVMFDKIDALFSKIEEDVSSDTWKPFTTRDFRRNIDQHIQPRRQPPVDIIIGLKPFVVERLKSVAAQLSGKSRGFVPRPFRDRRFRPSPGRGL